MHRQGNIFLACDEWWHIASTSLPTGLGRIQYFTPPAARDRCAYFRGRSSEVEDGENLLISMPTAQEHRLFARKALGFQGVAIELRQRWQLATQPKQFGVEVTEYSVMTFLAEIPIELGA
jgi:hypothetical protein